MDQQHTVRAKLIEAVTELGHVPSRDEFVKEYGHQWLSQVKAAFGSWTAALQACDMEHKPQKIDSSIFNRSIEKHIEEYEAPAYTPHGPYPTAAIISDTHWPFASQRVLAAFLEYVADVKPEWVILNGDAWDMYSQSKFPRSHNIFTPREERELALRMNREFWQAVRNANPTAKCVQMMGNHDLRPMKRILETYPAAEDWIQEALTRDFTFEGVETVFDPRQELFIAEDVAVFHGYRSQLGAHRDYTLLNTINGHSHVGGCVCRQIRWQTLWELNSGFAGDPMAKGLTYTPQKITHWTPGFAALDKRGPRFISA